MTLASSQLNYPKSGTLLSFVVPAHNEEALLEHCLRAIHDSMEPMDHSYEVIVVDDSSTDRTASIAQQHGARVIRVEHRQISATRNAGASAAQGNVLFFVDADTFLTDHIVRTALNVLADGKSGGGCVPRFDGDLPFWFRMVNPLFECLVRLFRQPGGSCLFCTREAFDATGGFSEEHYAAEDAVFIMALKKLDGFVVLAGTVITSGRKFRSFSFWSFLQLLLRLTFRGPDGFRSKEGLDMWYGPAEK